MQRVKVCPVCASIEWYIDYDEVEDGEMRVDRCVRCHWPPPYPVRVEEWRSKYQAESHRGDT